MDALAEANANAREVDHAVRISGGDVAIGSDGIVDDDESEAERKALVEEAETAQRLKDVQAISEGLKVPHEHSVADPGFQEPSDIVFYERVCQCHLPFVTMAYMLTAFQKSDSCPKIFLQE